jgi:hypothetical protein
MSKDSADELLERVKVIVRCRTDSTGLAKFARDILVDGLLHWVQQQQSLHKNTILPLQQQQQH